MLCLHGVSKVRGYVCDHYAKGQCYSSCVSDQVEIILDLWNKLNGEECTEEWREEMSGIIGDLKAAMGCESTVMLDRGKGVEK